MAPVTVFNTVSTIPLKNLISANDTALTILWKKIYVRRFPSIPEVTSGINAYIRWIYAPDSFAEDRQIEHHCHVEEDVQISHTTYVFSGTITHDQKREDYNFALTHLRSPAVEDTALVEESEEITHGLVTLTYVNAVFVDVEGVKTYQGRTSLHLLLRIADLCGKERCLLRNEMKEVEAWMSDI